MVEKVIGSLDAFSALEAASLARRLDIAGKRLLRSLGRRRRILTWRFGRGIRGCHLA